MRVVVLSVIASLFIFHSVYSQFIDQKALAKVVLKDANTMAAFLNSGDYKDFLKYIHPLRIQAGGGEAKMITLLSEQNTQLKRKGIIINSTVFDQPSEIVKSKNELQCTLSQHTELKPAKGRVITHTTILAISEDNGKNWKFINTNNIDLAVVRKLFPNISPRITIPPKKQPTVYTE